MKQVIRNLTQLMPWVEGYEVSVEYWTSGFSGLSLINCDSGLSQAFSGPQFLHIREDPILNRSHITNSHSYDLLKLVRKSCGSRIYLSSYWPWNSSSFTETLFLKKGCQQPFFGRLRQMPTLVPSPKQGPALSFSLSTVDQNSSTPAGSLPKTHFL